MRIADFGAGLGQLTPEQEIDARKTETVEAEIRRAPFFRSKWGEWERFKRVLIFGLVGAVFIFGLVWLITY
jgi:hypothetical protein